jgi:hypothetical protein
MAGIETVSDSIELAQILAFEMDLREDYPSYDDFQMTVDLMNTFLHQTRQNTHGVIATFECFELIDDKTELAFMSDAEIEAARIGRAIIEGRIDNFSHLRSAAHSGFVLGMFAVRYIAPRRHHTESVLVPVEAIRLRLAV